VDVTFMVPYIWEMTVVGPGSGARVVVVAVVAFFCGAGRVGPWP
jgi:hypothetical protein